MKSNMRKGFDYVGVSVSYICHDGKGNYLMSKRSTNCRDEHGTWDFGGGGLDLGCSVENTLLKELKEEYCVTPVSYEFVGYYDLFRKIEDKDTHWLALNFIVLVNPDEVKNGEPHKFDELKWFKLDNLPSPLHSAAPLFIKRYGDKLK